MTTFTTEDREHAFGATINVEPIPFAGWVNTSPPHIVDSGASVMNNKPVAWMSNGKEFYVQKNYCPDFIPLYTHPAKTLTDEEIHQVIFNLPNKDLDLFEFARAILKKAQEK